MIINYDCFELKLNLIFSNKGVTHERILHQPGKCYEEAIQTYGKQNQIMVAIEEMSELTKELSKNYRGNGNVSAISEEIADVQITLAQLQMIFDNREEVGVFWRQKIQRLQKRLEETKAEELIKNLS